MVLYRFHTFDVDVDARELRGEGTPIHLEPQAFDLLVHLVEHRARVVPKHELLDEVWGHRYVSEAAITTRVKEVRRAVGDDGRRQSVIQNVHGRGYRFVAPLLEAAMPSGGLIGRATELDEVVRRLGRARVVTLVGPGGVGKSTLALAAAEALASSYPDGVHVVELAPLTDASGVLPALAMALDTVLDPSRPDEAARAIARRGALIVLDNCEHVVDEVAVVVGRLLRSVDGRVDVLATSRVRLGLGVEDIQNVGPLRPQGAVDLFIERATAARSEWHAGPIDESTVHELVDHLDRLPLTIEMAAARLGSMTFGELDAAVREGGRLLHASHRTPTHRHRTLGSLVEWSAQLLDPSQRRVFTECSVFAASFTTADALQVVAEQSSCHASLAALAERSLLTADLGGVVARYRLLDTVKTVAATWLHDDGPEMEQGARRRHAQFVASVVAEIDRGIRGADEVEARRRLESIVPETRVAHRWASEHDPLLASQISGSLHLAAYWTFWTEPATWSQALLDRNPERASELAGAKLAVAALAANRGELQRAWEVGSSVLSAASDAPSRAAAMEVLSDVALYDGRLEDCSRLTAELYELGSTLADPHFVSLSVVNASLAEVFGGDPLAALDRLDREGMHSAAPSDRAWIWYTRGEVLGALGDPGAATAFREAIQLSTLAGNPLVRSVSQIALAADLARVGDAAGSLVAASTCLRGYLRHGNFVHAVTAIRNLVEILVGVGDDQGAAVLGAVATRSDLRASFGTESVRLGEVLGDLIRRVGTQRYERWAAEGAELEIDQAVALAAELVDRHH